MHGTSQYDSPLVETPVRSRFRRIPSGYPGQIAHATHTRHSRDAAMIDAIVGGDRRAQNQFVAKYGRLIYHVIRQIDAPDRLTDDIYQSVFVSLWERDCRRLRYWSGRGAFTSYLCTVVRRIACDEVKRLSAVVGGEPLHESAEASALTEMGPEKILEQHYYSSAISRVISQLRPADARLIIYRHIENLSYGEIGLRLDMSVSHVGVALFRGMRRIKRMLEAELVEANEANSK